MMNQRRLHHFATMTLMLSAAIAAFASVAQAQTVVLENGKIIPVSGEPIEKGSVLIKNGRIEAVGESVDAPFDAKVIDCEGKVIFPGMIDAHTWRGLDVPNESPGVTPFLNVYDAIDPSQLFFEDSLRDGVLSIHVSPGNNTIIDGMTRVVHPIGLTPEQMTTAPDVAMKLSVTPKTGYDRMRQMAEFREAFRKLDEEMGQLAEKKYEDKLREDEKDLSVPPDEAREKGKELIEPKDIPDKNRNLLMLSQGKLRNFIYCGAAMDVPAAIRTAKQFGFLDQSVLVLGSETFKAVDALKEAGRPVVLDGNLVHTEADALTGEEEETFVPKVIDDAGLKFALQRQWGSTLGERYLWYQAARCVREGVSRDHALKSITLWPAEMLGLGDRLGSLEKGKDANVLVLSGDPLDMTTWVELGFVQGEKVYDKAEDIRLNRLFAAPEDELGPSTAPVSEPVEEGHTEVHKGEYQEPKTDQ